MLGTLGTVPTKTKVRRWKEWQRGVRAQRDARRAANAIKPAHDSDGIQRRIAQVVAKPALYVGRTDLQALRHYLDGYCAALQEVAGGVTPLAGWQHWIEGTFGISDPRWSWVLIVKSQFASEAEAIRALPGLYAAYRLHVEEHGSAGLLMWARKQLQEKRGADHFCPGG
jgi:hypothetical protein